MAEWPKTPEVPMPDPETAVPSHEADLKQQIASLTKEIEALSSRVKKDALGNKGQEALNSSIGELIQKRARLQMELRDLEQKG